jgi:hypothetical protein
MAEEAPPASPSMGEPRLSSSQLETDRSLSDLGNVRVNLDLSGLQELLQGLTNALDTKAPSLYLVRGVGSGAEHERQARRRRGRALSAAARGGRLSGRNGLPPELRDGGRVGAHAEVARRRVDEQRVGDDRVRVERVGRRASGRGDAQRRRRGGEGAQRGEAAAQTAHVNDEEARE